jgi:hypothetical protein
MIFVAVSAAGEHSAGINMASTIKAATLDATDAPMLNVSNDTVSLIGTSDITALLYNHYNSGVIVAPLKVPNATVLPVEIVNRLKPLSLSFEQLDGFLQRAMLWDAGYIYSPSPSFGSVLATGTNTGSDSASTRTVPNPFLKVYTRNGIAMSAIAPTRNQMERAGCSVQICMSDKFGSTLRAVSCQNQDQVFQVVQCAIDVGASRGGAALSAAAPDGRQRAAWTAWNAEDRSMATIQQLNKTELAAPDVNVARYEWSPDPESRDAGSPPKPSVKLLAIHTVPFNDEPPVGQCPASRLDAQGNLLPSLTIPCAPYEAVVSSGSRRMLSSLASSEWSQPQESALLASWLKSVAPKSGASSPTPGGGGAGKPSSAEANTPGVDQGGPINSANPSSPNGKARRDTSTQIPVGGKSSGGFNSLNLIPILVGALALIAVAIAFVVVRKRKHAKHHGRGIDYGPYSHNSLMKTPADDGYYDAAGFLSPAPGIGVSAMSSPSARSRQLEFESNEFHSSNESNRSLVRSTKSYDPEVTRTSSDRRRKPMAKSMLMTSLRRVISDPSGGNGVAAISRPSLDTEHLKLLQTDPNLSASRISYDKIVFERVISRSTRYEVWLCQYEGEELAVKRLVQRAPGLADLDEEKLSLGHAAAAVAAMDSDDSMANAVEAFVAEIQITAALEHPNLARFVGVAWARLPADSLCLALEYQTNGDLRSYMAMHREKLSVWNRLKMKWARGIASGLGYLHSQQPVVLHLELNSTHVLLSDRLRPKLIDFGERLSAEDWTQLRVSGEMPMAANLQQQQRSFPYWAAPEVLRGEGHLMASDVYSFGMLLVELDACAIPFTDAKNTSNGKKLKPFQMMNMVISGRLIPSLPASCPDDIREIVERCTDLVPGRRPKMAEVLRMLELVKYETVV